MHLQNNNCELNSFWTKTLYYFKSFVAAPPNSKTKYIIRIGRQWNLKGQRKKYTELNGQNT